MIINVRLRVPQTDKCYAYLLFPGLCPHRPESFYHCHAVALSHFIASAANLIGIAGLGYALQ